MSSDKRPAKVRLFSSNSGIPIPARRHDDPKPPVETPPPASIVEAKAPPSTRGRSILLTVLFLLGCAIGGAALPLLGFVGAQG